MTAVSFSIELLDQKEPVSGYETQMALAALSFAAGRQGTWGDFFKNFRPILYEIEENGKTGLEFLHRRCGDFLEKRDQRIS